jgi:uncharacterized protein involved in response to NO
MKYFFSSPFRPFFVLAALTAVLIPILFSSYMVSDYTYYGAYLDVISWHSHEMLFGFSTALLAGFLLTASANWSGRPAISGVPLFLLSFCWVLERVILAFPLFDNLITFVFSLLFFILFLGTVLYMLKSNKNLFMIFSLLSLLFVSKVLILLNGVNDQLNFYEEGKILSIYILKLFLLIFSARLIPFFSNSFLKEEKVRLPKFFFVSSVLIIPILLIFEIMGGRSSLLFSLTSLFTSALLLMRVFFLWNKNANKNMMIFSLTVAHFWLFIHFFMLGLEYFHPNLITGQASLHALMVGALGMFSLSIMSRVSFGHTGREIESSRLINTFFVFISIAAVLRVFVPIVTGDVYAWHLHNASGFWSSAYLLFLIKFFPIYTKARLN